METVGFIGLGNMGGPVAGHIQSAGFPMIVFDLREEATHPFEERGAKVADSVSDLARRSDVDSHGTADARRCGASRLRRRGDHRRNQTRRRLHRHLDQPAVAHSQAGTPVSGKGAHVLDAPVASGQPGAARGIHEVMVGGDKNIFERAKPVLEAFGDQVLYAGPLGSGSICKLVHQMINSTLSQSIAEGLTLGVKPGSIP